MASVIKPQLDENGECLKWEPANIPSNKPFLNITTSAYNLLTSTDVMNFIKTKTLVYSPFHPEARYVHFEIGYSKESKWLNHLADKWNEFANFFVAGFFEAVYTTNEVTYVQVDAKLIDYDTRFRNPSHKPVPTASKSPSANAFAQRRNGLTPSNNNDSDINVDSPPPAQKKRTLSDLCSENDEERERDTKGGRGRGRRGRANK